MSPCWRPPPPRRPERIYFHSEQVVSLRKRKIDLEMILKVRSTSWTASPNPQPPSPSSSGLISMNFFFLVCKIKLKGRKLLFWRSEPIPVDRLPYRLFLGTLFLVETSGKTSPPPPHFFVLQKRKKKKKENQPTTTKRHTKTASLIPLRRQSRHVNTSGPRLL